MDLRNLLENKPEELNMILRLQFDRLDSAKMGYITGQDIIKKWPSIKDDELKIILKEFDSLNDGKIKFDDFNSIFIKLIKDLY